MIILETAFFGGKETALFCSFRVKHCSLLFLLFPHFFFVFLLSISYTISMELGKHLMLYHINTYSCGPSVWLSRQRLGDLSLIPQGPQGRRREMTLDTYPLTFIGMPWYTHAHPLHKCIHTNK